MNRIWFDTIDRDRALTTVAFGYPGVEGFVVSRKPSYRVKKPRYMALIFRRKNHERKLTS
jgi:uncharacterized protein (DUF2141 family)